MPDDIPQSDGDADPFDQLFQKNLEGAWGKHWDRYNRAVTSGNIDLSEKIHGEVKEEATRKSDLAIRKLERMVRGPSADMDFPSLVASNPKGWGTAPPPSPVQGEIRNAEPDHSMLGMAKDKVRGLATASSYLLPSTPGDVAAEQDARMTAMPRNQSGAIDRPEALREGLSEFGKGAALQVAPLVAGTVAGKVGQMAAAAPKTTAGVAGSIAAGLGLSPSEAGPAPSDRIRELQINMREAGIYDGKIDGVDGELTRKAASRYNEHLRQQESQAAEQARVAAEAAKAAATKAEADAKTAESKRLSEAAQRAAEQRAAGEKRIREMDETVEPWRKALRKYAPAAGYGLGIILGAASRKGMNAASDRASANAAQRADDLMTGSRGDWPNRASKVNQFWSEGGAKEVPFKPNPGNSPPFKANQNAGGTESLYQPPREFLGNTAKDAGMAGIYGVEAAVGRGIVLPQMQAEYDAAYAAVERDPSEANIERLQAAKDKLLLPEVMTNMGQAGALTHLGTGLKWSRSPSRPNVSAAESERGRIDSYLTSKAPAESNYIAAAHARQPDQVKGHTWHKNPTGWTLQDDTTKRFVSPSSYLEVARKKR